MVRFDDTETAFAGKTDRDLFGAYWLYRSIGIDWLTRFGFWLVRMALLLRLPIFGIVKSTIFKLFCGGETIDECAHRIESLARYNIKTILDYSAEGKEVEEDFDAAAQQIIAIIDRASGDPDIPFAVFKCTGLGRFALLTKLNLRVDLTEEETGEYQRFRSRVESICAHARSKAVPVFIDAEESWIQGAIDELAEAMMVEHNHERALIYNTIQLYRTDRLDYLHRAHRRAVEGGYFLGVKLVRGAYMEKERERASRLGYASPIQADKADTDRDFNLGLTYCVENIEQIALCCGSHNETSSKHLFGLLRAHAIDRRDPRVFFSQLLGMSDHISYNLAKAGYNVAKYVPFGPVRDVIPYLIRRAQENTSISGQMSRELSLIIKEKMRREESRRLRS